jgi:hypothetical protein
MLGRLRVALKFMTYGILVGVFFAPRSGAETRRDVTSWIKSNTGGLMSSMGMGGGNNTGTGNRNPFQ